jgi:hypothetical protein
MKTLFIFAALLFITQKGVAQRNVKTIDLSGTNISKVIWCEEWTYDYNVGIVKDKLTKKRGLYIFRYVDVYDAVSDEDFEKLTFDTLIPCVFDEIVEVKGFKPIDDGIRIVKLTKGNKTGIVKFSEGTVKILHDKAIETKYDNFEIFDGRYAIVNIGGKWGVYNWLFDEVVVPCILKSKEDIPMGQLEEWGTFNFKVKLALGLDSIEMDRGNGDGIFLGRSQTTQKWGMFQHIDGYDLPTVLIPTKYDSIWFFPWNAPFTAVYEDGKAGFYLSFFTFEDKAKQSVNCLYNEYRRYTVHNTNEVFLAVSKNGKWGWVDWLTGEEKGEFMYDKSEDLPMNTYKQSWVLE